MTFNQDECSTARTLFAKITHSGLRAYFVELSSELSEKLPLGYTSQAGSTKIFHFFLRLTTDYFFDRWEELAEAVCQGVCVALRGAQHSL